MEKELHSELETSPSPRKDQPLALSREKALVRKLDRRIIPLMMVTYMLQSYDKGILSAASQFDINDDLGLTIVIGLGDDGRPITNNRRFSNASLMFYVGYLIGTYPMMVLAQRYSVPKVLGSAIFAWSAVLMCTAACTDYGGLIVIRLLLGMLESAVAPAFTVYVTFWWTRHEQVLRTGLWYCCVGVATAISPLINYGLGQIQGPLAHWKPLFLILGAVTCLWSIVIFLFLPDYPTEAAILTEDEREIALVRLERNQAGTVHKKFERDQFFEALVDYKSYSGALIVLLTGVPSGALGTFGTMVINGFGFDHFTSLALTCPIGGVTFLAILTTSYLAYKVENIRYISIIVCALMSISGTLICWLGPQSNRALLFAGVFLVAVQVASGGLAVSLAASNVSGHTKKSTVSAMTFVGYCVGNITGPLIFGASPGPIFHAGFLGSFVCLCGVVVVAAVSLVVLWLENRRRSQFGFGSTGVHSISEDLTDRQNRDFRYVL